jgi:hypothetical protein
VRNTMRARALAVDLRFERSRAPHPGHEQAQSMPDNKGLSVQPSFEKP